MTKGLKNYCYGVTPRGVVMKWHNKSYIPLDVWFDKDDTSLERAEELASMVRKGKKLPEGLTVVQSAYRE